MEGKKLKRIQRHLYAWYVKNRRRLPWRKTKDPYKIWVSEVMLQQTRVETVIPYYERFLRRFPDIRGLAEAPVEVVLKFWSGLGYYQRARQLHRGAQRIVENFEGRVPSSREALLKLPGIGRYTAGAILSIAFGRPEAIVDGNVIRVLTRLFALGGDPTKNSLKKKLWGLSTTLLPRKNPGDFNQALMELGATVCLAKNPRCKECPLEEICLARQRGDQEKFPELSKRKSRKVKLICALISKNGRYLFAKRPPDRHLESMWEFPQGDTLSKVEEKLGVKLKTIRMLKPVRHSIMNQRIFLRPHLCQVVKGKFQQKVYKKFEWIPKSELPSFPTSSLNFKIVSGIQSISTRIS